MSTPKKVVEATQMAGWIYKRDKLWRRGEAVAFLVVKMEEEQLVTVNSEQDARTVAYNFGRMGILAKPVKMVGHKFSLI